MPNFEDFLHLEGNKTYFVCKSCSHKSELIFPENISILACKCGKVHCKEDYDGYYYTGNPYYSKGVLKIGQLASLDSNCWEIVGIANKFNPKKSFDRWVEYVMLNRKTNEFSFLNDSYGNYTWFFETEKFAELNLPEKKPKSIHLDGDTYELFQHYSYRANSITGQFPYNPIMGRESICRDYICPPNAVSIEHNEKTNEITCFKGRHFSRTEISEIVNDEAVLNQQHEGVGMAQPFYGNFDVVGFTRIGLAFIVLLVILNFGLISQLYPEKNISSMSFVSTNKNRSEEEFVSKPFILKDQTFPHYLNVSSSTSLSNEWLEMAITLVNEKTGDERELGLVMEYYSGAGWSEGSDFGEIGISSLPDGRYHLKIKCYSNAFSDKNVYLEVEEYAPTNWNFWLLGSISLALIILANIIRSQFERMRSGEIDTLFGSA